MIYQNIYFLGQEAQYNTIQHNDFEIWQLNIPCGHQIVVMNMKKGGGDQICNTVIEPQVYVYIAKTKKTKRWSWPHKFEKYDQVVLTTIFCEIFSVLDFWPPPPPSSFVPLSPSLAAALGPLAFYSRSALAPSLF